MDALTFIAALISALAWPATVLVLLLVFRHPLVRLVGGIQQLKYQGLEINLEDEIRHLRDRTQEVMAEEEQTRSRRADPEAPRFGEQIERVARVSPRAAVTLAWIAVDQELRAALKRTGLPADGGTREGLQQLCNRGLISKRVRDLLNELRLLYVTAVHAWSTASRMTTESAIDFGRVAHEMRLVLHDVGQKAMSG